MKITQAELITRLAMLSGSDREIVKRAYDDLLDEILCLEDGQSITLNGLGVFLRSGGRLRFEPDENLANEINVEFAGQQPVKLDAEQEEDEVAPEVDDDLPGPVESDDEWAGVEQDETIPEPDTRQTDDSDKKPPVVPPVKSTGESETGKEKPASESPGETADDKKLKKDEGNTSSEPGSEEADKKTAKSSESIWHKPADSEKKDKEKPAGKEESSGREPAKPAAQKHSGEDKKREKTQKSSPEKDKKAGKKDSGKRYSSIVYPDSSGRMPKTIPADKVKVERRPSATRQELSTGFTIAALFLAALLIFSVGYVIFSYDLFSGDEQVSEARPEQVIPDPMTGLEDTETAEADQTERETAITEPEVVQPEDQLTPEETPEVPPAEIRPEPVQPAVGEYGLHGEMDHSLERAFGLVIHSLSSRSLAESEVNELRANGFRATTYSVTRDGSTRWRVSVGQFADVASAQQAASELPGRYRENYFVHRINR